LAIGADEGTNVGVIQTRTNSDIVFATNVSNERMRITSGGNVGIATSSPMPYDGGFVGLSIGQLSLASLPNTANSYLMNNLYIAGGVFKRQIAQAGAGIIMNDDFITFYNVPSGTANATVTLAPRMQITSGGNVGIGTTSPSQKLVVQESGDAFIQIRNNTAGQNLFIGALSTETRLNNDNATPLTFWVNGSERMRITSGGNLLVNNTSSVGSKLIVRGDSTTSGGYACILWDSANTDLFYVRNDGYIVTGTGANSPCNTTTTNASNLHVFTSNGALARSTASSARFKENIKDWQESGLNTILSLKPKTFTYKANYYSNPELQMLGLIAEEVAKVSPFLAEYENEDRTGQVENVRYANIVVPLIKAVQEIKAELDTIKKQII
jgi:hypothetical protein